jgi:hypothetical protein
MPKVTEAHLEARRRQIVDAAAACFSQRGFHQTTMQDICKQAALSPGRLPLLREQGRNHRGHGGRAPARERPCPRRGDHAPPQDRSRAR